MSRVAALVEMKGIPVVLESFDLKSQRITSKQTFTMEGVPAIREVFTNLPADVKSATEFIPELIDALTRPLTTEEKKKVELHKPPPPPRITMTGTYTEVQEYFHERKWTDGLPITPPTEKAVAEMLTGTTHAPDEELTRIFRRDDSRQLTANFPDKTIPGVIEPFTGMMPFRQTATVEKVAINAVMAGCKPEYMPVVLAMTEAGGCAGYQGCCGFGYLFIVSGPIAKEIGMNSGGQLMSPGNRANMSLGRAATLIGLNLAGAKPGAGMMERCGSPIWGLTFAENEDSPWEGLNVAEGFDANESVLFMAIATKLYPCQFGEIITAKTYDEVKVCTPDLLVNNLKHSGQDRGTIVFFTPDSAKVWKERYGFTTTQELRDYLWDNVTRTCGDFRSSYWGHKALDMAKLNPRGSRMLNADHADLPDDALVPRFWSAENIKIVVAGGEGEGWGWGGFLWWFATSIDKWR